MHDVSQIAMLLVRATPELCIIGAAAGRATVLGHEAQALLDRPLAALCPTRQPDGRRSAETLASVFAQLQRDGSLSLPWRFQTAGGELRPHELHLTMTERHGEQQVAVCMVDVSRLQAAEALNEAKNELLQMVATGQPLQQVLDRLTALIESQFEGLYCTVLLLDLDGRHIRMGAGPRMPAGYMQALDGIEISASTGSCGTAMYCNKLVIVDDIATDPLWAPYRELVLPHGFKACWSAPIHAANHGVIGSFAMYYREVRQPTADELSAMDTASHLAGLAIDQARRDQERQRAAQWLEEQVQARTQQLLAAQDELVNHRKLAALGQLLAGIAHEMNTPLGNALLSASALRARSQGFGQRLGDGVPLKRQELADWVTQTNAAAELVEQNVDRALLLINRFKQLTEGGNRATRLNFDLRDAVLQAWARVQSRLPVEPVQLSCTVPAGLQLDGYREVLQQVLEQLLENACLHAFRSPAGRAAAIEVSAVCTGGPLMLTVRDNGQGMPAADLARAFEPFFTTTFGQGGSGLGLFVAHSLVSGMLGGTLTLDSQPGQGTTVRLTLPLQPGTAQALAA